MTELLTTPLDALHRELGGRMVPFAGYRLPVQYPAGVMAEHNHTRSAASLFDVSHMGQIAIRPPAEGAAALERVTPADIDGLPEGRQRYALLMAEGGGIADDMMVARLPDRLFLVVNGSNKHADLAIIQAALPDVSVQPLFDRALMALQGPSAEAALAPLCPEAADMRFMDARDTLLAGRPVTLTRSGYTGEDGYEIGCAAADAEPIARALLAQPGVMPAGLGARDSLRLEAGLCLHGNDISAETSPCEADLIWSIQKVRRPGGARAGGYPGHDRIAAELTGAARRRVGLKPEGRAPVRPPAALFAAPDTAEAIGHVTSGGFGPTVGGPVAMGYVAAAQATPGTRLWAEVRGTRLPVVVTPLPFVPARFKR
jgi:aminomethyltransferase